MAAREQQYVSADPAHSLHDAVGARRHLFRRFPARTAVAEQLPVRTLGMDVDGEPAFIPAVIPFEQIGIDFSGSAEPGQFAGSNRATQRTREHFRESHSGESFAEPSRHVLATLGEREIAAPRVLTGNRPRGFAVSGEVYDGQGAAHDEMAPNGLCRV